MEVKELGHVVLYIRDLQRSVAFYRNVLGWRQVYRVEAWSRDSRAAARTTSCC